jgi:purine-binding chemotaxis protein CheW
MAQASDSGGRHDARSAREALASRLRTLEDEIQRTHGELAALGGEPLPGIHLLLDLAGRRALLPTTRVREIVRLVATTPLPGAPPHVLGTFVCRGAPVLAVDLATAVLGSTRPPPLDAQIVVLAGTPSLGLVVDRVQALVEQPRLHEGGAEVPEGFQGSRVLVGLCVHEGEVLPLLDPTPLAAELREWAA